MHVQMMVAAAEKHVSGVARRFSLLLFAKTP
jgi:hypothetical protein